MAPDCCDLHQDVCSEKPFMQLSIEVVLILFLLETCMWGVVLRGGGASSMTTVGHIPGQTERYLLFWMPLTSDGGEDSSCRRERHGTAYTSLKLAPKW